jgi:hypothetical protein
MEPADYIGFIGRNSGDKHRYIAAGDSGQGITNGVIASLVISRSSMAIARGQKLMIRRG